MRKTMILLMGPSGSGKSTARQEFREIISATEISADDEIVKLAEEKGMTYQQSYALHHKDVNARTHEKFLNALATGDNVIVDRTNLTREARAVYTGPAREAGYEIFFVRPDLDPHTPLGASVLADRGATRTDRGEPMPDFVVDQQVKAWVSPLPEEDYDALFTFRDIPLMGDEPHEDMEL